MHNILRKGVPAAGLVIAGVAVLLPSSVAAAEIDRTFSLGPGQTKTFTLPCSAGDADGCDGPGKTFIEAPAAGAKGRKPNLTKVTILTKGVTAGRTKYTARVRNGNPAGTAPVRIKLAITLVPNSS